MIEVFDVYRGVWRAVFYFKKLSDGFLYYEFPMNTGLGIVGPGEWRET